MELILWAKNYSLKEQKVEEIGILSRKRGLIELISETIIIEIVLTCLILVPILNMGLKMNLIIKI